MALEELGQAQKRQIPDGISIMTMADLNQSKAEALNEQRGSLRDYDCAECRNKGYIAFSTEIGIQTRECRCMEARRSIRRIKASWLSETLAYCTLENYETGKPWQAAAKEKAQRFLSDGADAGKWMIRSGTPGTGKTHLCTAVCGELLNRQKSVRYMLWRTDAPKLKALIGERGQYESLMRDYADCDVLYIDDFLKGSITEADINLAFELLNARYINRSGATVISSEMTVEQILDQDEAIGSRIAERAAGYMIRTPKDNIRLQKAAGK